MITKPNTKENIMKLTKFYLFSSNKNKLKEMKTFINKLSKNTIIKNINSYDLPEPQIPTILNKNINISNKLIVGIYKSFLVNELLKSNDLSKKNLQNNEYILLEDTILEDIKGNEILDIKFWIKEGKLKLINEVKWITTFVKLNKKEEIKIYQGEIKGKIIQKPNGNGFGFDNYFVPYNNKINKYENFTLGIKKPENYNARFLALEKLIKNKAILTYSLKNFKKDFDIKKTLWQNDYSIEKFFEQYNLNLKNIFLKTNEFPSLI